MLGVNLLLVAGDALQRGPLWHDPAFLVISLLFTATALGIILTKRRWLAGALLGVMLSLYWLPGVILGWSGRSGRNPVLNSLPKYSAVT